MNKNISWIICKTYWILKKLPIVNKPLRNIVYTKSIQNLFLLQKILSNTQFSEKYWVIGGVLLGWVRELDILPGNEGDIDFALNSLDEKQFLEIITLLKAVGFQPYTKWKNNSGQITEYVLLKDGCKFEFFLMFEFEDKFRYFGYSKMKKGKFQTSVFEAMSEIEKHKLSKMTIFNVPFLVPENPQEWLSERYGNWNEPIPEYRFIENELPIVYRAVWIGNNNWNK